MAQKKKAPPVARSAAAVSAAGKKAAGKAAAATKKPGRTQSKPKTVASKAVAPKAAAPKAPAPKAAAKVQPPVKARKPIGKTAGTAASVKSPVKAAAAKPAAVAKPPVSAKAPLSAKAPVSAKPPAKPGPAPARAVAAAVKPAAQKITAPVAPPKSVAEKAAAARQVPSAPKKPVNQRHGFKASEFIVYPAHGVGKIIGIEEQEIAGMALELFVINFDKEKLTLRVPTGKLESVGMRKLSDEAVVKKAMETLKGRARVKRTMWSRRAQEYVAKINSGDLVSIAEVVRDLYRSEAQPEQSYSERQLYEDALDRMAREIAAVEKLDERGAVQRITDVLSKSARGRRMAAEAEGGGDEHTHAA
jgi:CarD family transcriptional regulator